MPHRFECSTVLHGRLAAFSRMRGFPRMCGSSWVHAREARCQEREAMTCAGTALSAIPSNLQAAMNVVATVFGWQLFSSGGHGVWALSKVVCWFFCANAQKNIVLGRSQCRRATNISVSARF